MVNVVSKIFAWLVMMGVGAVLYHTNYSKRFDRGFWYGVMSGFGLAWVIVELINVYIARLH
ncbi:MAG TPA: hypothetical protein VGH22_21250 [Candidatus Binatia bacterium]